MKNRRFYIQELILVSRQLYYLIKVSVSLPEALRQLYETYKETPFGDLLNKVRFEIEQGKSLSDSFSPFTPPLYSNLLAYGERENQLLASLKEIVDHYEAQELLEREIKSSLLYPYFLLGTAVIMGLAFIFFIWAPLSPLFLDLHFSPGLTVFYSLMALLNNTRAGVAALVILSLTVLILWKKGLLFKIPVYLLFLSPYIKKIYIKGCIVKVFRVLSLLLNLNYPLPKALTSAGSLITDPFLYGDFKKIEEKVSLGKSLEAAFMESRYLNKPFFKELPASHDFSQGPAEILTLAVQQMEVEILNSSQSVMVLVEPLFLSAVGLVSLLVISLFWIPFYKTIENMPIP